MTLQLEQMMADCSMPMKRQQGMSNHPRLINVWCNKLYNRVMYSGGKSMTVCYAIILV